jgi:hypothetical protein
MRQHAGRKLQGTGLFNVFPHNRLDFRPLIIVEYNAILGNILYPV